ncbi:MAG: hypothetical protein KAW42_07295 [Candidatus Atribacteria bacterium]|nr:hypothetical protein [Candidatus Atribacteria bacterium]
MLDGENMKYWILEILKVFAVPAILILIIIVVLTRFIDITNQEISNVVLGVMLGVILGFSADLIKRGFDDLTKMQRFKKISLRLLEEDAEDIYRLLWLWEWSHKSNQIPEDVKKQTPPMIILNYWNILKQDKEFLLLGVNNPFNEIFKYMWNFEKINSQIRLAEGGDKEAANTAVILYEITVEERFHKKLLLIFKTEQEIKELDKIFTDRKTQNKN